MGVGDSGAGLRARVIRPFRGVRDGRPYPERLALGEIITGDLARVALENAWAEPLAAPEAQAFVAAPESKESPSGNPTGPTGAAKSSSSRRRAPRKPKTTSKPRAAARES